MGNRFKNLHTRRESTESFDLKNLNTKDKNYCIKINTDHFGWLEGKINFSLFGCGIRFHVNCDDDVYARRCAEYLESITKDNITRHTAMYACLEALVKYVADMLDEHSGEFDLGDLIFDENSTVEELIGIITPMELIFERSGFMSGDECPPAFSLKLGFSPVPDEVMEIALHGDVPIYAGEYRGVSAWNENLLKKKYNYLR